MSLLVETKAARLFIDDEPVKYSDLRLASQPTFSISGKLDDEQISNIIIDNVPDYSLDYNEGSFLDINKFSDEYERAVFSISRYLDFEQSESNEHVLWGSGFAEEPSIDSFSNIQVRVPEGTRPYSDDDKIVFGQSFSLSHAILSRNSSLIENCSYWGEFEIQDNKLVLPAGTWLVEIWGLKTQLFDRVIPGLDNIGETGDDTFLSGIDFQFEVDVHVVPQLPGSQGGVDHVVISGVRIDRPTSIYRLEEPAVFDWTRLGLVVALTRLASA